MLLSICKKREIYKKSWKKTKKGEIKMLLVLTRAKAQINAA